MKNILPFLLIITIVSSCGVITKTRYGNGLKVNLENNLFSKKEKTIENKAEKAVKYHNNSNNLIATNSSHINLDSATFLNNNEIGAANLENDIVKNKTKNTAIILNKILEKTVPKAVNEEIAEIKPIEKHAKIAGWLFYGGLVGSFIPYLNILAFLACLIGFILAFVALAKIRESGDKYRGKGLAISIIVIYSILLLIFLAILTLFILFLLA
jgi:hypothetical protein